MKAEHVNINNRDFLKIELEKFNQGGNSFYLAKINASDLVHLFTVQPTKYQFSINKNKSTIDEEGDEYYKSLISEKEVAKSEKSFQRSYSKDRGNSISKYIETSEFALFPNTIIATCNLINDFLGYSFSSELDVEEIVKKKYTDDTKYSILASINNIEYLYIPFVELSILVIDGQHRLEGLKQVDLATQKLYELAVSFIIQVDRKVVAEQFYTINYEQKSVNKSLLYHLKGEFSSELTSISFLHNVARTFNEFDNSPLFGRIKMLGTKEYNQDNATISQAFLIDTLLPLVDNKVPRGKNLPIFLPLMKEIKQNPIIITFLYRYFTAIRKLIPEFDQPENSIASKSMAIGAFIKYFQAIFPDLYYDSMDENFDNIDNVDFESIVSGFDTIDFTNDGIYGKIGSGGTMSKLKDELIVKSIFLKAKGKNNVESLFSESSDFTRYKQYLISRYF